MVKARLWKTGKTWKPLPTQWRGGAPRISRISLYFWGGAMGPDALVTVPRLAGAGFGDGEGRPEKEDRRLLRAANMCTVRCGMRGKALE